MVDPAPVRKAVCFRTGAPVSNHRSGQLTFKRIKPDMARKYILALVLTSAALLNGCSKKDPEAAKLEYLRSGDAYAARHQDREAVVEYRNAIQQDPRYGEARLKLAEAYMRLGDAPNAYREAVRAADLLPDNVKAQITAGNLLLIGGQFEDAKTRAERALEKEAANIEALLLRANALAGLKKTDDAIVSIQEAIRANPSSATSFSSLGNVQALQGKTAEAEEAFKRAVSIEPRNLNARLALVNFYWSLARIKETETELTAALQIEPRNVLANRMLAAYYARTGRLPEAEAPLKVVADAEPGASSTFALADYYVAAKRLDDARRLLGPMAEKGGDDAAGAKTRLAALDAVTGDYAKAGARAGEVLAAQPVNADALLVKAKVLQQSGRLDEALTALQTAAQADPRSASVQMALGRLHLQRGDSDAALKAFSAATLNDSRLFAAAVEASKLHLAAGHLDEAEQLASNAFKAAPSSGDTQLLMARIHIARGRLGQADAALKALAASSPAAGVYAEMGLLELARNNKAAARSAFEKAEDMDPVYLNAVSQLVRMDLDEKRYDAAKGRAQGALDKNPSDRRLAILAGTTYIRALDYATGERVLKEAIERDPNNLEAYLVLSRLYFAQKRLPEAAARFQAMAEKQPGNAGVQTAVGMFYDALGKRAEAKAKYEQVLQTHPNAGVAANNLAWIYAEEGTQLDLALQLAQTAKAQLPERGDVSDTLGWVYHKKGMSSSAVQPLLEAIEKEPRNPYYHYHLGVVYNATGDKDKARQSLERSLKLSTSFDGADDAKRVLASLSN